MKFNKLHYFISISMAGFIFYYSVYTPLTANLAFAKFLSKRSYNSYDEFFNTARVNLSFEIPFITWGVSDFAKALSLSPDVNKEFALKFTEVTVDALRKIQKQAPENYMNSVKLAFLLTAMSARDKKYLPSAEAAVSHCVKIIPLHPYNETLKMGLSKVL